MSKAPNMSLAERNAIVTAHGLNAGLTAGVYTAAASSAGVYLLNKYSRGFATKLGVSGKLACVVMPTMFFMALKSDHAVGALANPALFAQAARRHRPSTLPFYQRAANWCYYNQAVTLIGISVPAVLGIFKWKGGEKHLTTSMRVMHTRVIGQATVLGTLLIIMGFSDFMRRRGPFLEPEDEDGR